MARLTDTQWAEMREGWESSDAQGVGWLTAKGGGRWDIGEDPIRARRTKENWRKRRGPAELARDARRVADALWAEDEARDPAAREIEAVASRAGPDGSLDDPDSGLAQPSANTPEKDPSLASDPSSAARAAVAAAAEGEDPQVLLRAQVLESHRREWRGVRKVVGLIMQSVMPGAPSIGVPLKVARALPATLRSMHDAERHPPGLDAELIDRDGLTDEQLDAIGKGRRPR